MNDAATMRAVADQAAADLATRALTDDLAAVRERLAAVEAKYLDRAANDSARFVRAEDVVSDLRAVLGNCRCGWDRPLGKTCPDCGLPIAALGTTPDQQALTAAREAVAAASEVVAAARALVRIRRALLLNGPAQEQGAWDRLAAALGSAEVES